MIFAAIRARRAAEFASLLTTATSSQAASSVLAIQFERSWLDAIFQKVHRTWITSAGEAAAREAPPSSRVATYTVRTATFPDPNALRIWPARIRSPASRSAEPKDCQQKLRHHWAKSGLNELVHPPAAKIPQT
jgi:hypothetical protein